MRAYIFLALLTCCFNCKNNTSKDIQTTTIPQNTVHKQYPSDVLPFMDQWKILLGDGTRSDDLVNYKKDDFFYVENDGDYDWVVYKTPNSGITSPNSGNTRSEMGQKKHWKPMEGGKLTGTLKVQHVSTTGDARVAASFAVVVGQIHGTEGHENEPLKIFYKKFPGHTKGSVFWNYEINTEGSNDKRWDFSTAVWGYDMSVLGSTAHTYPDEPENGIALGEEFSYEINVYRGIMYLKFMCNGHETKTFTKNLIKSEYIKKEDIPQQITNLYAKIGRDGTEKPLAYTGELQNFKQGAYNQTNGKKPITNMIWSTGSNTYDGDIAKQYAHGSYAEVWFRNCTIGEGVKPEI
ncbi:alginate lyase [Tamlana nanhaiensis]|uniref:Alginate lyase n=1 Tax=Neotamlana nanhaiensis TaxID=1382798 RepID=A0A0D7VYE8_9FLAO|nr:polysaccharide lyase family 7 protein [Tamlana nanhaiensis]KJD31468.1 alginate lyase [Tamlana nanhaiensis]